MKTTVDQMRSSLRHLTAPETPRPALPSLPDEREGTWLTPAEADLQHAQVWVVRTPGGDVLWAQIDGYDTERGRRKWRAISLTTRRVVRVQKVARGSCPRRGGRRERARR